MTTEEIEPLFRAHYAGMLVLAHRLLHDDHAARNVVHDVFASLLAGASKDITPAYLLQAVRNRCLKQIRDLGTRERLLRLYALDLSEIEEEQWPDADDVATLNRIVGRELGETDRRVLLLRFRHRKSYREIAEAMGFSEVSVYKHLRHAMQVIRQKFQSDER